MKRKVLVIGIGAGNPNHLTLQGVEALNRLDAVFIPDKGSERKTLADQRHLICDRHIRGGARRVGYAVPSRRAAGDDYGGAVDDWHDRLTYVFERLLTDELAGGETGGFLVWGDPSLYDSTLRILERVRARGQVDPELEVVPGITAIQALTAAHAATLNAIGQPVTITTGRRLAEDMAKADSTVVMLDGQKAFRDADPELEILWGAYLGTPDEMLVAGRLGEVADTIAERRDAARAQHGWIMDTYLLKRRERD